MSKKKNTLQDLNAFLKQQAATLVTPDSLSQTVENISEVSLTADKSLQQAPSKKENEFTQVGSKDDPAFRKKLYDFIIESLEVQKDSLPEDKMLINTALYLKNGSDWKDAIRQYWRQH
jgi:hypothetical protein